jgi:hypothetical protein
MRNDRPRGALRNMSHFLKQFTPLGISGHANLF